MDIHYILNGSEKVLSVPVTQNAAHEEELMKSDFVRLSFDDAEGIELPLDAYIVPFTDGVRYSLLEPYKPEQRNEEQWHYEPLFQHPKMYLGKVPFVFRTKDSDNNDTTQLEWDYTGYVGTLLGRFCEQINAALGLSAAESFTYTIVGKIDDIVSTTFSSMDILSGLSNIAGKLRCEYHLDWELKILYFGHITLDRVGVDKPTLEVGVNVGSPSVRSSKDGFWNAFEPQGSTRNISRKAVTGENVQSTIRLSLRNYLVSGIEKYPDGIIYTDGKGNVITKSQFEQSGVSLHLKSLIFDEVYPKLDLYVYDVRSRERYLLDDNKKKVIDHYENGVPVYKRYSIWYMRLAYPTYNQLGEVTAWTDYTIDPTTQIIDGKSLYGAFQPNTKANAESSPLAGRGSGDDGGYGFALNYHTDKETIPADEDAGDSGVQIKAGDYEIVFQQDGDLIMPTTAAGGIIPKGKSTPSLLGNIVNLYNIVMDSSFTQSAQNELENVAKKEIANYAKDNNSYSVKAYPDAFEGKDENLQDKNPHLFIGQSVTYKNGDYTLETRVMKLVTNLDYDFVQEITVGNEVIKGTTTTLKEQVQSILSGSAGVGGGGVDENLVRRIIKAFGDTRYLSKINDDTAQGLITLIKGLQVGNQFVSGLLGEGGVFRKEADGKTYLEADKLYIRMKAYFDTIEIRDFKHSAGNRVASPAGAKCVRVAWFNSSNEELVQTQENLSSVAYFRCYFRADDGEDTVRNNFVVGDQVYCHITTVNGADDNPSTKGLNQKHYWRLCIGKNTDNNITEDGEGWVDLSNRSTETISGHNYTGYQINSDVPEPQDSMVQLGNVNDTTRQGAIIEFVTGADAPSYQIYQGIDSFSLTGRNMITLGYNSATGKAELNVYGDAFIGDPNRTTYIEYVQDDGTEAHAPKLKIKAEVEFTNSQQDLDNFVQSHQNNYDDTEVRGLIDGLQDQIDGQVESWFYNYAPVHVDEHGAPDSRVPLNIAPYSDWTTEADKIAHLGDTFTDNSTGYCWRFSRNEDTNAFEWVVIEDSALISALQKAAKAQETADNKRRVFLVQPTPPYDAGDIWVNATYPANYTGATDEANHKYNNDILKCVTAKASGSSFSINDWTLSSKYTDDTKFNGYISALLNDTGLSGDAAAAAAQRAVLSALGVGTVVSGGLLLTSLIGMRQYKNNGGDKSDINNYTTWAGISGEYNANVKGGGIAAWYGGGMVDHEVNTTATDYAKSLFRFDGSGYMAGGNITWDAQGRVAIKDITTLIAGSDTNILNALTTFNNAFHFNTQQGSSTILSISPQAGFDSLSILENGTLKPVATQEWANGQFVTKTFFDNIFRLYNGTTKVNVNDTIPSSNNLNIEAMFGFWTKKYISALGQGDDGSTSYTTLAQLNDVTLTNPTANQILKYDGTHWVNAAAPTTYVLPTATDSVLGGVKVGTTLAIANGVLNLPTTGVTAGTYKRVTVDAYGRVTSGDNTDTDTNTWRNIYVGGTSKVGTGIDTKAINFKAGSNVAISYVAAGTGSGQSGNANYFDVVISATDTTYSAATQSAAGLMSAADKKKLDGIAEGANKYSLPLAASGTRGGVQIGFTTDAANRKYAVQLSSEKMYVNVPWENTWRGIQNNLTSQSTTDSLSAYQGYLLANGSARDNTKLPLTGGTLTGTLTARDVVVQSAYTLKIGDAILKWDSDNNALKLYKLSGSSEVAVNFYATGGVSALGMSEDGSAGAGDVTWALLRSNDDERPIAWSHISDAVTAQGYATQSWVTSNFNKYVLPTATTSALGGIKVGYTTSGKNYKVQVDASGNAFVNVPWDNTVYTLPAATTSALGGIKVGYTTSGKNYKVELDSSNNAFVNVPWENTNTTYSAGKGLRLSGTQFISDAPRVSKDSKVFGGANTWIMEEYNHGTAYNLPSDAWYHIMSTQGTDTAYGTQLALGMTTQGVYYRVMNGNSWSDWISLVNTWRGIQNNLTSDSTTDSLSAAQGKALANGSARDSTKLPLSGGTMSNTNLVTNLNADLLDGMHATDFSYAHQTNFDFNSAHHSNYVTFDKSDPAGAPVSNVWYNGFVSTHNSYLSSYIINQHRTQKWYVGYFDSHADTSPSWVLLIHSGNIGTQSVAYATSAGSATQLATARTLWGQSFDGTANIGGTIIFNAIAAGEGRNLLYQPMATNDFFRIRCGGDSDAGWAEIATADGGNEPIYVRQYTGVFSNVARTLTLLDGSGNTSVPNTLSVGGALNVTGAEAVTGLLTANGGIAVPSSKTLKIGDAYLSYDSNNNAIRVSKNADGTGAANFYAIGGVSALGQSADGSSGVGDVTWALLASNSDTRQIALSHLTTSLGTLTGYTTSGKNYAVQKDSSNHLYVNVPWENTTYSLPLAANGTRGGIQLGYTQSGKNYPVQLSGEKAYVNVPWENTVYTLPQATTSALGGIKVGYDGTTAKTYAIALDNNGRAYVNVPWTDTTYDLSGYATTSQLNALEYFNQITGGSCAFILKTNKDREYVVDLTHEHSWFDLVDTPTTLGGFGLKDEVQQLIADYTAKKYVSIDWLNRVLRAYNNTTQVAPNDLTTTIDNLKLMVGTWTEQYLTALGRGSDSGGGGQGDVTWALLAQQATNNRTIHQSYIADILSSYATTSWVTGLNYATQTWVEGKGYATTTQLNALEFLSAVTGGDGVVTLTTNKNNKTILDLSHEHSFLELLDRPTTVAGYGITDAVKSIMIGTKSYTSTDGIITLPTYYIATDSRAANTVLAAPNGASGAATFRALVAADIPTLTKSKISDFPTTWDWSNITNKPTAWAWTAITGKPTTIAGYGITDAKIVDGVITLGAVNITPITSVAMTVPSGFSISGSPISKAGTLALSYASGYEGFTTELKNKINSLYSWFEVDSSGNVKTKDYTENGTTKHRGFYSPSFVSALGQGDDGQSGVGDVTWELLEEPATNNRSIHLSYISSALASYLTSNSYIQLSAISDMATKTWVGQQGYLKQASLSNYYTKSEVYTKTEVNALARVKAISVSNDGLTFTWQDNSTTIADFSHEHSFLELLDRPSTIAGYGISLTADDIPNLPWGKITSGKPTTISGYGITDAVTSVKIGTNSYTPASGIVTLPAYPTNYYSNTDSHTANTVLAAPNGSSGVATFRSLVAADIPTLTKSKISDFPTSWAWSALTGVPTTLAGYGITDAKIVGGVITLGANTITPITSVAMTVPTGFSVSGSPISKTGTLAVSYASGYEGFTTTLKDKINLLYSLFTREGSGTSSDPYVIKANYGLYTEKFLSALGQGDDGQSGVGDVTWELLAKQATNNRSIHSSYISSTLAAYATQSWVSNQNYATQTWVTGKNYATQSWVSGLGYATQSWVTSQGYATTSSITTAINALTYFNAATVVDGYGFKLSGHGVEDVYIDLTHEHSWFELLDRPSTLTGLGVAVAASDIPNLDWSKITTGKPTTLAGYGITDAVASISINGTSYLPSNKVVTLPVYTSTQVDALARLKTLALTNDGVITFTHQDNSTSVVDFSHEHSFLELVDRPTTIKGYGITILESDVPNLPWSKITSGKPTTVAGYGITDAITTGNIGSQSVSYATTAGGVSWANVSSKPSAAGNGTTPVYWTGSGFTACTPYSGASVNYANSAGSASQLSTPRTLWGQSFNGTGNVSGNLSSVGHLSFGADNTYDVGASVTRARSGYFGTYLLCDAIEIGHTNEINTTSGVLYLQYRSPATNLVLCYNGGNVGVGNSSPSYRLDVSGVIYSNTGVYSAGYVTALSDARHKTIVRNTNISVEQIAAMRSVVYRWSDRRDNSLHVGSIAQDWQGVLPQVVSVADDKEHTLGLQYGVAALVAAITTARKVVEHEERIKALERENADLKQAYSFIKNAYEELKLKIA